MTNAYEQYKEINNCRKYAYGDTDTSLTLAGISRLYEKEIEEKEVEKQAKKLFLCDCRRDEHQKWTPTSLPSPNEPGEPIVCSVLTLETCLLES